MQVEPIYPRIFHKFNGPEMEIKFVKWTAEYLICEYPPSSVAAGSPWKIGRQLFKRWVKLGVLRVEGWIPPSFQGDE